MLFRSILGCLHHSQLRDLRDRRITLWIAMLIIPISLFSEGLSSSLAPGAFPTVSFIIAGLLAVLTGTSWGTMAVMFPVIVPAAHAAAPCNGEVFYGTVGGVLAGAVFGDHCSPMYACMSLRERRFIVELCTVQRG